MNEDEKLVIRTMWHGSPLSIYEELSLRSFLRFGYEVELYAYSPLDVPAGIKLCDANKILPESRLFAYSNGPAKGSFAAFSNLFRFKLLCEKGGVWADLDTLCLKPLDALPENCAGTFIDESPEWVNQGIVRFSAYNNIACSIYKSIDKIGQDLFLGQTSEIFKEAIANNSKDCVILPQFVFYEISWNDAWMLLDPDYNEICQKRMAESYCMHWWNTFITMGIGLPKTAFPPKGSYFFEKATEVFESRDLPTWPVETFRVWVNNFKDSVAFKAKKMTVVDNSYDSTNTISPRKALIRDIRQLGRSARHLLFSVRREDNP